MTVDLLERARFHAPLTPERCPRVWHETGRPQERLLRVLEVQGRQVGVDLLRPGGNQPVDAEGRSNQPGQTLPMYGSFCFHDLVDELSHGRQERREPVECLPVPDDSRCQGV